MASRMRSVGEPALLPRLWPTRRRRSEAQREYVVRCQGSRQGIRGVCGARLRATRPRRLVGWFQCGAGTFTRRVSNSRRDFFPTPARGRAAALALVAQAETAPPPKVIPPELVDRQPAIIDAQVQSISEHSPPGSQAYFLGFAGVGQERVFAEEIDLAARRFAERFGLGTLAAPGERPARPREVSAGLGGRAALRARGAGARDGRGRCAGPRAVLARLEGRHDFHVECRHAARDAGRKATRRDAEGVRHPLARGRGLRLLFRQLHPAAGRQSHHRDHRRLEEPAVIRMRRGT